MCAVPAFTTFMSLIVVSKDKQNANSSPTNLPVIDAVILINTIIKNL